MVLRKHVKEMINLLEGNELFYSDWGIVMVEYPFVWYRGKKIRLNEKEWGELVKGNSENPDNEGYWLRRDAEKEFGIKWKL